MKKLNKLFLATGSVAAIAAPVAAVVSCGTTSKLSAEEMLALKPQSVSKDHTMLVTDGGSIDDKSFNQQAANALELIKGYPADSLKSHAADFIQPKNHDAGTIVSAYESAVTAGAKTILAPGFYHVDAINSFIAAHKNAANFIVVDGVVKAGNVASITFDTKQPAFEAGYWAAESLKAKTTDPVIGMWGGGNFSGVTDYMTGFVAGVKAWSEKNGNKEIKFVNLGNKDAFTNSGFDAGKAAGLAGKIAPKADIILPVAGGQTQDAVTAIAAANRVNDVKLIGVDTDQKTQYQGAHFLTSIEKNISTAFKAVYDKVASGTSTNASIKGFGDVTVGTLDNQFVGVADKDATIITAEVETLAKAAEVENYTWDAAYDYMSKHFA